jgi:hypothetical protein
MPAGASSLQAQGVQAGLAAAIQKDKKILSKSCQILEELHKEGYVRKSLEPDMALSFFCFTKVCWLYYAI